MYVTEEARKLFTRIAERFQNTALLLELMTQWMVDHQKFHDTTKKTDVTFLWGVRKNSDFCRLCPSCALAGEYNFTDGMKHFSPLFITLISPMLRSKNNRLGGFLHKEK